MPICPYCLGPRAINAACANAGCGNPCAAAADQWFDALQQYNYPTDLSLYAGAGGFPGFFPTPAAAGYGPDRSGTQALEARWQAQWPINPLQTIGEITFWKMFSQPQHRNRQTNMRLAAVGPGGAGVAAAVPGAVAAFANGPNAVSAGALLASLGIGVNQHQNTRIALAFTFPAVLDPTGSFPMVDQWVAQWVNANVPAHNTWATGVPRPNLLTPFIFNLTTLAMNDFPNYVNWMGWARDQAGSLAAIHHPDVGWRARDVEMAVFTAQQNGIALPPI